jgi:glycosyltransferase involved in cell wall biosynthesis
MRCLIYVPQMAAFGGIERHVCTLSRALSSRGHIVLLLTTSNSLGGDLRALLREGSVELRELAVKRGQAGRAVKGAWMLREALRARFGHWDVIYTNGQSALARFAWLAAGEGTRVVHHHHTAASDEEQRSWSPSFRRVLKASPELVACSCSTRDSLARAIPRSDIRFLPYLTPCPVGREMIADRSYTEKDQLNFGFMGRLVSEKGIDAICELSLRPELSGITWHIHGSGAAYPPAFFRQYPGIVYHGPFLGADEHAKALLGLDAVVLFSAHNEGMPLSLIEAMSAGLPWLATDQGGTREIAAGDANSIVISGPADTERLAGAAAEMARRLRSGQTSRLAQRDSYDRTFNPETVLEKWYSFLEGERAPGRIAVGATA